MSTQEYSRLGEKISRRTLPNGLEVIVVHKPYHEKRYAFFATSYGGMDLRFKTGKKWKDTPAGIAHYLEHKMFDTEHESATQALAKNGAVENAFTANDMTAYYFECTEKFYDSLRILLNFVSIPYFTQESVDKEQGIIAQEIRMSDDDPEWRNYLNIVQCLYHHHPMRTPVVGTVESIAHITPQTLYDCHKAFYTPSNMVLICIGSIDLDEVCAIAQELLPAESGEKVERDYGEIEDLADLGYSFVEHQVELCLLERRSHFILHYLHAYLVTFHLVALFDLTRTTDVQTDGCIEFQGVTAGGRLGVTEHHTDLLS